MESNRNSLFLRPQIFHAHDLYRKVLVSLQSSAPSLVISRKRLRRFYQEKNLREDDQPGHFRLKFQQSLIIEISYLILMKLILNKMKLILNKKSYC